jgi:outer membrane biosynthesis protein TonB
MEKIESLGLDPENLDSLSEAFILETNKEKERPPSPAKKPPSPAKKPESPKTPVKPDEKEKPKDTPKPTPEKYVPPTEEQNVALHATIGTVSKSRYATFVKAQLDPVLSSLGISGTGLTGVFATNIKPDTYRAYKANKTSPLITKELIDELVSSGAITHKDFKKEAYKYFGFK